ncbi:MAG: hypothetical protein MZV65_16530 [Chromatiales bacterium]|nr:hypothetical protein [Chromatiales bacterium]
MLVIYMQLSETPKLGFTGAVNANLLIHGRQKCPKYWVLKSTHKRALEDIPLENLKNISIRDGGNTQKIRLAHPGVRGLSTLLYLA